MLFAAGIWLIFYIGTFLHAPIDLAGEWELQTGDPERPQKLVIEQSGKFFSIQLDDQPPIDMKLIEQSNADDMEVNVLAAGGERELRVSRQGGEADFEIELKGEITQQWQARRISRAYDGEVKEGVAEAPPEHEQIDDSSTALTTHAR